jgi:hypothetical protein
VARRSPLRNRLLRVGLACAVSAATIAGWLVGSPLAHAGGGPENVLLVVNSSSWASQAVANQYIQLRQIPGVNVCYLDWDGGFESTDVKTFREQILGPVLQHIARRGLDGQIDYVVYSSDFPTTLWLDLDVRGVTLSQYLAPVASINSATFLAQMILAKSPATVSLSNNRYMRATEGRTPVPPMHGFRSWYGWGPDGQLLESSGQRFYLSTMLAVTSGRGNSVSEVANYLSRSAAADGTHPPGTIYFMKNDNVRSAPRDPGFDAAVSRLKQLGVGAVVQTGNIPNGRRDVQGLMFGIQEFDWPRSGNVILPGALCEHFTSYGGVMTERASQTPLTVLLRYGAAGASGTVAEPFALSQKFPAPAMQVYYASGCTLAESFYQAVLGPYQLLIVGDPLCRPWANIPQVTAVGIEPGATLKGVVEIRPAAKFASHDKKTPGGDPSTRAARFELFVDGSRIAWAAPDDPLVLDTKRLADGSHELRIVAIAAGAIETQGRAIVPVVVDNHGHTIEFTAAGEPAREEAKTPKAGVKAAPSKPNATLEKVWWDETLVLTAKAPGMAEIVFSYNGRVLNRTEADEAVLRFNPRRLGTGPMTFQAAARAEGDSAAAVLSRPITLTVEANRPLPAWPLPRNVRLVRGMQLLLAGGETVPIQETFKPTWLTEAGVKPGEAIALDGVFDAAQTDVYQFQFWHDGDAKLAIDGHTVYDGQHGDEHQRFVPVALAKGLHRLKLTGVAGPNVRLRIVFGGPGALSLSGDQFRHVSR